MSSNSIAYDLASKCTIEGMLYIILTNNFCFSSLGSKSLLFPAPNIMDMSETYVSGFLA